MSTTTAFVEAVSEDPFVRDLHRRAVRLLNDPSLDRQQRELHVRRLQGVLLEHQAKQAAKAAQLAQKKAGRGQVSRSNRNQGVADQSQVVARRREFGPIASRTEEPVLKEPAELKAKRVVVVDETILTGRSRPVLTLRRA
ncbi:MAG: hypothetical protein KA164_05435 [Rhodoferax sp.]|nr:hypothetical protein [Rhodoferax sp.]